MLSDFLLLFASGVHGASSIQDNVFTQLSFTIGIAAVIAFIMRLIRQPLILGYIIAGLIVGPSFLGIISQDNQEMFDTFSSIGIALLLFIIGLGMNVSELKKQGKSVLITAFTALITIGSLGFTTASLLGYLNTEAMIIGISLFFSSTIIIVKILSDRKEQNRLHGQLAIGIILFDDLVATIALLVIAAAKNGGLEVDQFGFLALKGLALGAFLTIANLHLLGRITRFMASSQELLFLFALSWGFGIGTLFEFAGFSLEVGALFAGVALGTVPYSQEITARLKPLRDFFVVVFFITLGESLDIPALGNAIIPALILAAVVMLAKPVVITLCLGLLGYTKRVSFKAGINLSQISEFSIILTVLAASTGLVRPEVSAVVTLVAMITIAISTYLMHYDEKLFVIFDRFKIRLFEREAAHKEHLRKKSYPFILFGYHKGGHQFINTFQQMKKRFVVVDYDPAVIDTLEQHDIAFMYGDATDPELMDEIGVEHAKLIVSTFTDYTITQQLVSTITKMNEKAVIICHASNQEEAIALYDMGATYVMIPHYIGSEKVSSFLKKNGLDKEQFELFREKHKTYLETHFTQSAPDM
jgi:Kef-type K+ transport system membrane component KefB